MAQNGGAGKSARMMSGLIFAGIDPVKAIKYQIMVTFMLIATASLSTIIAAYLSYRRFTPRGRSSKP